MEGLRRRKNDPRFKADTAERGAVLADHQDGLEARQGGEGLEALRK